MLNFDHVGFLVRDAGSKQAMMVELPGFNFRHRLVREAAGEESWFLPRPPPALASLKAIRRGPFLSPPASLKKCDMC